MKIGVNVVSAFIEVRLTVEDGRISGLLAGGEAKAMSSITITL